MLGRIVHFMVAQEADRDPTVDFDTILDRVREELNRSGLNADDIIEPALEQELRREFVQRLVPNPKYWRQNLQQRFCLFLVETKSNRYHQLLRILEDTPDLSYYVCYGTTDVIIRILGTEDEIRRLEKYLEDNGYPPITVRVEEVIVFYAHNVPSSTLASIDREQLPLIDEALSSRVDEVDPALVDKLKKENIVLGNVYIENHRLTGRIRAFVGLKFSEMLNAPQRRTLERRLREFNKTEMARRMSPPLTSLYRCAASVYPYMLQMIVDDQDQLDRVTDHLQELHEAISDTTTFVVAKNNERPLLFSMEPHQHAEKYLLARTILDEQLAPLTEQLSQRAPTGFLETFREQPADRQLRALTLFQELIHESPHVGSPTFEQLAPFAFDLVRGVVTHQRHVVKNAGLALLRDVVEEQHLQLVTAITNDIFRGDENKWQQELRQSNANWQKWGLSVWGDLVYPNWNDHRVYGAILQVPDEIMEDLHRLGILRNDFAHVREGTTFSPLVHRAREAFHYAYDVLHWIELAMREIEEPHISLEAAERLFLSGKEGAIVKVLEISKDIKGLQVETLDRFTSQRRRDDVRWNHLMDILEDLRRGQKESDDELLAEVEELLLPLLPDKDKGRAERMLGLLKTAGGSLSSDLVASIIATLLLSGGV